MFSTSPATTTSTEPNAFERFHALHHAPHHAPFMLPNAWDAGSAAIFQQLGAPAIATSSAAMAWSLGYRDGSALPREELLAAVRRLARVVHLPLSIDLEDGYSDNIAEVVDLVQQLHACGVIGINLEDGAGSPELLAAKIRGIRAAMPSKTVFINARCDVYLRQLATDQSAVQMTLHRLQQYQAAGADAVFVPGLSKLEEVRQISQGCDLPLNVMLMPEMPSIAELAKAGVRRFSVGPGLYFAAFGQAQHLAQQFLQAVKPQEGGASISPSMTYASMNALF